MRLQDSRALRPRCWASDLAVAIHDSSLDWGWLWSPCRILRWRHHMRAFGLHLQFRLYINSYTTVNFVQFPLQVRKIVPFSNKILSSKEFLYRSIRHSSAANLWLCCKLWSASSCCLIVVSSCLMYSVRRSLKAACAWRFLCLRSSEVAYIFIRYYQKGGPHGSGRMTYGLPSPFALLHLGGFLREALLLWFRGGLGEGLFLEGFEFGDRRDAADVGHDPGQRAG